MSTDRQVTLRIHRFDPGRDAGPVYLEHRLPYDEHTTILDALEQVAERVEPFAFQRECRLFKCGVCAVTVNGVPRLACKQRIAGLAEPETLVIEPLAGFPLIKDLLVDFGADHHQRAGLRPFPEASCAGRAPSLPTERESRILREYTACIRCAICSEICARVGREPESRLDPLRLLDLARLAQDPRDRADRLLMALSEDIGACTDCRQCSQLCPVGMDVFALAVMTLREMIEARYPRVAAGEGREAE